jgi:hypothetical protein
MSTLYGAGILYGDPNALYGRVSPDLLTAAAQQSRQTGLRVTIIDEGLNHWEYVAGTTTAPNPTDWMPAGTHAYELEWYSYRLKAAMVKLGNGDIIRARMGNPADTTDRQIYYQRITDPTNATQWTTWSVLYSGTHYQVDLQADPVTPSAFITWHSKADGIYRNNVKKFEPGTGKAYSFEPVHGDTVDGRGVLTMLRELNSHRVMDFYYTQDISGGPGSFDRNNYEWNRRSFLPSKWSTEEFSVARLALSTTTPPDLMSSRPCGVPSRLPSRTSNQINRA